MKNFRDVLAIVFLLYVLACLFSPINSHGSRHIGYRASCQNNLKQIALAFKMYSQDAEEKFPRVSNGGQGWAKAVQPYVKSWTLFQCPETLPAPTFLEKVKVTVFGTSSATSKPSSDYWYNARLSGISEATLDSPALTVLVGDGSNDAPPNASLSQIPPQWIKQENSPAKRHLDLTNVAFADGHVKWYRPERLTLSPTSKGLPTFLLSDIK